MRNLKNKQLQQAKNGLTIYQDRKIEEDYACTASNSDYSAALQKFKELENFINIKSDIENFVSVPNKLLPDEFSKAVEWLIRPYITLTTEEYNWLLEKISNSNSDFLKDSNGKLYTIGKADGGWALMPIQKRYYSLLNSTEN